MELFNKHLLDQKIASFKGFPEGTKAEICKSIINSWAESIKTGQLEKIKETSAEQSFLAKFFVEILGYQPLGSNDEFYNIYPKYTIRTMFADATLGFFSNGRQSPKAVVELKGANIPLDKKQGEREKGYTPVAQAFEYASNIDGCNWVIVSNFKEIRLYNKQRSQSFYSSFNVAELTNPETFKRFYYLFCKENLICDGQKSPIDNLLSISTENDENITKQFYSEYRQVRLAFFKHLQEHNPNLDKTLLLEKTQKFLDRFIFVLFCEDTNGLLPFDITKSTYETGKKSRDRYDERIWREFRNLFQDIDEGRSPINKYNGGLFKNDEILDNLSIKDDIWEELMKLARWDFETDLNVNILGHIFEQSISDLETMRAEISGEQVDKSKSKRKKEGVYYTPEYITKYIVENTVGRWIEENPDKMLNVKILDPACGSGAFLNQAHSFLTRLYKLHNEEAMLAGKGKAALFDYHSEAEILTNNLFGVDLNEESVEITKLSLWLKTATKDEQLKNLDGNIKCGNSLIDDPTVAGEKAFNWNEQFKEIMDAGGFDVVIGNPPYIFAREKISEQDKEYYQKTYSSSEYQVNTFVLFIERALRLINNNGYLGMIVPNTLLMISSISNLRQLILKSCSVVEIVNLVGFSFDGINVETVIVVLQKNKQTSSTLSSTFVMQKETQAINIETPKAIDSSKWAENINCEFNTSINKTDEIIIDKLKRLLRLENSFVVKAGLKAYEVGKGEPKQTIDDLKNRIYDFERKVDESSYPYLDGINVGRYLISKYSYFLKYGNHLAAPRSFNIFQRPRVLIREITGDFPKCLMSVFTTETYLNNLSIINVLSPDDDVNNLKALAGILNSKLISYYFMKSTPKAARSMFPKLILQDLRRFPIPNMDDASDKLTPLVDKLQDLHRQMYILTDTANNYIENQYKTKLKLTADMTWESFLGKLEKSKNAFNNAQKEDLLSWFNGKKTNLAEYGNDIQILENRLNAEVYKLYNLTDEEIKIIEEGSF